MPKQNGPSAFGGRAEAVLHVSGVLQTLSIIQEHYHLFLVAISGAYLSFVEAIAVWMEFRAGTLPYLGCWKACNNSGGNSYENSVTGWCTGGCWFRYRHADLYCTRVSSSCR